MDSCGIYRKIRLLQYSCLECPVRRFRGRSAHRGYDALLVRPPFREGFFFGHHEGWGGDGVQLGFTHFLDADALTKFR